MLPLLRPIAGVSLGVSGTSRRVFLPVFLLLAALSGCDDPSAEEFVRRAEAYRQEGNLTASIIELKNALQQEPRNARARYLLGQNYLAVRNFASAEKELLRARDYGFDPERLTEPLAQLWLAGQRYETVLDRLRVRDASSTTHKAAVLIARARAHRGLGRPEQAEADYRSALTHDPENIAALVGLARAAMRRDDGSAVASAVAQAFQVAPKDLGVLALKGDHDFMRGYYPSAEAHYQAILRLRPDNIATRIALARTQIFLGKPDQAIAHLDAVISRARGHPDANYLRASLALQAGDHAAAKLHGERVLLTYPDHVPSLLIAGAANYILGQLEQAERYLARLLAEQPAHDLGRRLHASTRARLERRTNARAVLTPLLDDTVEVSQLVAIVDPTARERGDIDAGRVYFDGLSEAYPGAVLADPEPGTVGLDEARSRLRASLEQAPNDVRALLRLANLESRAGNSGDVASLLERAIAAEPYGILSRALLGQLHLRDGRPAKALDVTEAVSRKHPENRVLLGVVGLAQLRLGRAREAKVTFRSVVDLEPGSTAAHYLLALAYRDSGDAARFKDRLEQVLARDSGHLRARIDMGRLLVQAGDLGAASDLVDRLHETAPEESGVLELAGTVALLQGRLDDAIALFERLYTQDPATTAALKLAFAQQRAGDGAGSRATLARRLESAPDDADARIVLANKYLAMGELDAARAHYRKVILLSPSNAVALNNLAWVDLRLGGPDAALYAERAFQLASDDPRVMDTYGLALLERGDAEGALRVLRRAAKEDPVSPEIQTHLARALVEQGNDAEARSVLRRVLSENVEFPERSDAEALLNQLGG